jgi:hypothetical protein
MSSHFSHFLQAKVDQLASAKYLLRMHLCRGGNSAAYLGVCGAGLHQRQGVPVEHICTALTQPGTSAYAGGVPSRGWGQASWRTCFK